MNLWQNLCGNAILLPLPLRTIFWNMQVFKFGGASVNSVERIKNVGNIIGEQHNGTGLVVIISAMGKTTNALEKVAEAFFDGRKDDAIGLFHVIKEQHLTTAKYLLIKNYLPCETQLNDFFTEVEWLLHDRPVREYDYYYDQIVCIGEMLSTVIVSHYLNEVNIKNTWIDVRDIIRTDNEFRDGNIDWAITERQMKMAVGSGQMTDSNPKMADDRWRMADNIVHPLNTEENFQNKKNQTTSNQVPSSAIRHLPSINQPPTIFLTQGFVGATDENESITLGREGSDYTAAIFANLLHAESVTIWKDVEGVMNADPKIFSDAKLIAELNYAEVTEMAYYGAQVIHPKTIKPLYQKSIPLFVKCFLDANLPGTVVHNKPIKSLPPIIVKKTNQVLLHFRCNDFSFIEEKRLEELYQLIHKFGIRPNLTQNGAITFICCIDDRADKIQHLAFAGDNLFDIQIERGLELLTIRHYNQTLLEELTAGKNVVLEQKSRETVQFVMRS